MSVTIEQSPAEAHGAAIKRHLEAAATTAAARSQIVRLEGARHRLLNEGARTPGGIAPADLAEADRGLAEARHKVEIAAAKQAAAHRAMEAAEIVALAAEADDITRQIGEATMRVATAGEAFATAFAAVRQALDDLRDAGSDLSFAGSRAALFNDGVHAAAAANSALNALPPSERPKVRRAPALEPIWSAITIELMERGGEDPVEPGKLLAGLSRLRGAP